MMSLHTFIHDTPRSRVVFGSQTLFNNFLQELQHLHCSNPFILSTPSQANHIQQIITALPDLFVGSYLGAALHTPIHITDEALRLVETAGADCLVALGGGSPIGLSKALALRTKLPQIAIPTTYSGSEATPIVGQTQNHIKTTQSAPHILPKTIIYDVSLTLSLPTHTSVVSGLNAIAHAIEALYSPDANPITDMLARTGISHLLDALPKIHSNPLDEGARSTALLGAWLCGTCLSTRMGLHHKLCHILGGTFNLPHADTHAVLLPHVLAYNTPSLPHSTLSTLSQILSTPPTTTRTPAQFLYDLHRALTPSGPHTLNHLGLHAPDLESVAQMASTHAVYPNPAPLVREHILSLLRAAFDGIRPA